MIRRFALLFGVAAFLVMGQTGTPPVLSPAIRDGTSVTGRAAPGSFPVVIYSISLPARTRLGTATGSDRDGNFAAVVKPKLVLGHRLVAVDRFGRTSAAVTVAEPAWSPAVR